MYNLTGKIDDFELSWKDGLVFVTFAVNEKDSAMLMADKYRGKERLNISVEEYSEPRSNQANKYLWVLCDKIAKERSKEGVKVTKEDVYRDEIRQIGLYKDDEVSPEKSEWRRKAWESLGTGWFTERVDFAGDNEVIRFYYGSSQYSQKVFARLLDGVVQDAKALGIETMTPEELMILVNEWRSK